MPPSLEFQVQFNASEPGDSLRQTMPGNVSEDRVMGPAGISHPYFAAGDLHIGLAPDEMAIDLLGIALLKASEPLGQHAVKGVGDHGSENIEVHLHQDRRRQGVKIEELDCLGDDILPPPPASVVADDAFCRGRKIVGNQEGRLLAPIPANDDLPELPFIIFEVNEGLMDVRIGVLPFVVRDVDLLPGAEFVQVPDQFLAPPPEGDEPGPLTVQQRQMFIGGELGIKDKGGGDTPLNLLPEGQDIEDLLIGFFLHDVGGRVEDQLGGGILGKEGQGPFHPLSPGPGPMLLENGFIPVMGNGVEVQIDNASVIQSKMDGFLYKGMLELQDMNLVQGVGIGGHGRAFGQDIETGEQSHAGIEGMVSHVGVPLCADELQGQKGQKITDRWNDLGPWQTGGTDQVRNLKLLQKRGEQKNSRRFTGKMLPLHLPDGDACRFLWNLRPFDGQTDLQTGATGKLGESLFRQDSFHRPDGDIHPFLGKQLGDLPCGEVLLSPGADFPASLSSYPVAGGASFSYRFGEVDFAGGGLMSQKVDIW